ncbi:MAG: ankyrin repeat domain-containing protein [Alphaproteobacteria bacterium]|nr:ankyrin repeat domain-containing protein [Alphaproteobacteria bacterium]
MTDITLKDSLEARLFVALHAIKGQNDIDRCLELIEKGADPNAKDFRGTPALIHAADKGLASIVKALIHKDADINCQDHMQCTPLYRAAWKGHNDIVRLLIEKGAALDTASYNSCTPLIIAATYGHNDIVQSLCDAGADKYHLDNSNHSALTKAIRCNQEQCAKILIKEGTAGPGGFQDIHTALGFAAEYGHADVIREMLDRGICPDHQHLTGYVHLAAREDKTEAVQVFLDYGIDINARDERYLTPLMAAAEGGAVHTTQLLLDNGADPNRVSIGGGNTTAKDIAVERMKDHTGSKKKDFETVINTLNIAAIQAADKAGTTRKRRILRPSTKQRGPAI